MKVTIKQEVDVKTLQVEAGVRYWEDATVNGIEDVDGKLIPFKEGEIWKPEINIETGQIANWPEGTTADIHYKVCDNGTYILKDESGDEVTRNEGYVPSIMSPGGNGYGDYIVMKVNETGLIEGWKVDLSDFEEDE